MAPVVRAFDRPALPMRNPWLGGDDTALAFAPSRQTMPISRRSSDPAFRQRAMPTAKRAKLRPFGKPAAPGHHDNSCLGSYRTVFRVLTTKY